MAPRLESKTEGILKQIRNGAANPTLKTVTAEQEASSRDLKARGSIWISRVKLDFPPDHGFNQVILEVIRRLGDGDEKITIPNTGQFKGEWVGHRKNADSKSVEPDIEEHAKYAALMAETSTATTLLFVHGGAHYWGAPSTFRGLTGKLANLTGGRCFSVEYRLAPQHPFPAALLDVLMAYLSLLYPPDGACHSPVLASSIVLVGDSSGAGICLALIQMLLSIHRNSPNMAPTIRFLDNEVLLPFPAGFAGLSTAADMTHSQRSWVTNSRNDVLPHVQPQIQASQPPCKAWPTSPPRGDLYCDLSALCHPLVSPTAAQGWCGAPPMWFGYGEEMVADEGAIIAQRAAAQGVCVVWEQFEGLPHSFPSYLKSLPQTALCFKDCAAFCKLCVEKPHSLKSRGNFIEAQSLIHKPQDVQDLGVVTVEIARETMDKEKKRRQALFEKQRRAKARL